MSGAPAPDMPSTPDTGYVTTGRKRIRPTYKVWAAFEHYDWVRDPEGYRDPVLPEDPGKTHALGQVVHNLSRAPEFFDYRGPVALCGEHVKVRLSIPFDADEEGICKRCAALVREGRTRRPVTAPPSGLRRDRPTKS